MDKKQELIKIVQQSDLPEDVKKDLIARIESQGVTEAIAKEVADLLDLQADVFEAEANLAKDRATAFTELGQKLDEADKDADSALNRVADDSDNQLNAVENEIKAKQGSADQNQLKKIQEDLKTPVANP